MPLSDHHDSEHFAYNRSWEDIETMLDKAERKKNWHRTMLSTVRTKNQRMMHARNYKALEGVCKTLRWVLGDKNVSHPLE